MQASAKQNIDREEVLEAFAFLRADPDVRQQELAKRARMAQGAVSKVLRGDFRKLEPGSGPYRLWQIARQRMKVRGAQRPGARMTATKERLVEHLMLAWDQTEEGADALVRLLDAVRGLRTSGRR